MSAETLRRAAALMRERAEVATPGPWEHRDAAWPWVALYVDETTIPEDESLPSVEPGGSASHADMEHIASWHPAVALAVADWLEAEAGALDAMATFSAVANSQVREFDIRGAAIAVSKGEDGSLGISADTSRQALAVARAYLGEQS